MLKYTLKCPIPTHSGQNIDNILFEYVHIPMWLNTLCKLRPHFREHIFCWSVLWHVRRTRDCLKPIRRRTDMYCYLYLVGEMRSKVVKQEDSVLVNRKVATLHIVHNAI